MINFQKQISFIFKLILLSLQIIEYQNPLCQLYFRLPSVVTITFREKIAEGYKDLRNIKSLMYKYFWDTAGLICYLDFH